MEYDPDLPISDATLQQLKGKQDSLQGKPGLAFSMRLFKIGKIFGTVTIPLVH